MLFEVRTDVRNRILAVRNAQHDEVETGPSQAIPVEANPNQAIPVEANPNQAIPVEANPNQAIPVEANPNQAIPVEANPNQAIPVEANLNQAAVSELITPESQMNNYLTPMVQITMPIKLDLIGKLQSQNSLISKFLSNTSFELQMICLKSENNQNQIFLGINMNINPNFLNLTNSASKKSTFISLRAFNTSASVSRYIANNESYTTFHLGQIVRVKNNNVNISTNFGCKNMTFKKESLSFQVESKSELPFLPTIVSSKPGFYCKPQLTLSYDFFPFESSIVKTIQMNKKQNISPQLSIARNSDVISHSKTESVAKIESGIEVDAVDLIKQSNLSRPESYTLVSSHPQPVTVQPSFFQKYGTVLLFSVGLIWVVINGYIIKKKKDRKPFD